MIHFDARGAGEAEKRRACGSLVGKTSQDPKGVYCDRCKRTHVYAAGVRAAEAALAEALKATPIVTDSITPAGYPGPILWLEQRATLVTLHGDEQLCQKYYQRTGGPEFAPGETRVARWNRAYDVPLARYFLGEKDAVAQRDAQAAAERAAEARQQARCERAVQLFVRDAPAGSVDLPLASALLRAARTLGFCPSESLPMGGWSGSWATLGDLTETQAEQVLGALHAEVSKLRSGRSPAPVTSATLNIGED
jgi:hypothetical protein